MYDAQSDRPAAEDVHEGFMWDKIVSNTSAAHIQFCSGLFNVASCCTFPNNFVTHLWCNTILQLQVSLFIGRLPFHCQNYCKRFSKLALLPQFHIDLRPHTYFFFEGYVHVLPVVKQFHNIFRLSQILKEVVDSVSIITKIPVSHTPHTLLRVPSSRSRRAGGIARLVRGGGMATFKKFCQLMRNCACTLIAKNEDFLNSG